MEPPLVVRTTKGCWDYEHREKHYRKLLKVSHNGTVLVKSTFTLPCTLTITVGRHHISGDDFEDKVEADTEVFKDHSDNFVADGFAENS